MTDQMTSERHEAKSGAHTGISLGKMRNILVSSVREYQNIQDDRWIKITDLVSVNLIMNTYGDKINRQILSCVASNPDTVMGIVSQCSIPQTTGYSKIMGLMEFEFLIPYDMVQKKSKQVSRYISTFKELQIDISENQVVIRARPSDFLQNQARI